VLRVSIIILAILGGGVLADPSTDSAGPVDPVAVVGRYQAKLTWSHCAPAGAKAPVVALTPIDSRLELDLATARDGLGAIVIAGDSHQLTGTAADVTATLTFGAKKTELVIALESGCTAKGTVKRIGSGIAACDDLAALARVEAGCGAVAADARLEDVAAIDAALPGWAKTKGSAKQEARVACEGRVAALRPALVDAACVAVPAEDAPTLLPECRDLAARVNQLMGCRTLDARTKAALRDALPNIHVEVVHTDAASISVARQQCLRQKEAIDKLAPQLGCP
jgi:hypothetical protein